MHKTILTLVMIFAASLVWADGVSTSALSDPNVVPIIRVPAQANGLAGPQPLSIGGNQGTLNGPFAATQGQGRFGFCTNAQRSGTPPDAYGYDVKIACDHILVGVGILVGLSVLAASGSTN